MSEFTADILIVIFVLYFISYLLILKELSYKNALKNENIELDTLYNNLVWFEWEKIWGSNHAKSFFSPSPSHGAVISSVAFAIRSFTSVSYNTFVPFWGTVLAQHGQARYPTWASTLPHLGTFAARMLPICPQYGRLRLGFLKKTEFHLSSCCFRRTKSICPSPYDNPS